MNFLKLKHGDCCVFALFFNIYQKMMPLKKLQSQPIVCSNFLNYWWSSIHASSFY